LPREQNCEVSDIEVNATDKIVHANVKHNDNINSDQKCIRNQHSMDTGKCNNLSNSVNKENNKVSVNNECKNSCKMNKNTKKLCGKCTRKILVKQRYVTCKFCTLDYHIDCIDSDNVLDSCIDWMCHSCFTNACNYELPFSSGFIDLNCRLQKGFKVAHLNIQGILSKVDYLDILLHDNNIDVLCLNETWLTSNIDDSEIMIDGYSIFRLDRCNGKTRGGVMCYVKSNLCTKQNVDIYDSDVEALFLEVNLPNTKPIAIGTVYRPPDSTVEYIDKIDNLFQKCNSIYDDVYILGDLNLNIHRKYESKKVSNLAKNSQMCQLITDYTRITESSRTTIDLIFVSRSDLVISSAVHSLGLSDHSMVYVVRKHKQIKLPPRTVKSRNFKNFDESKFSRTIESINWDEVKCINNVDDALSKWQSLFNQACDQHAPFKTKRIKGHLPEWVDTNFLMLCNDRDYLYSKAHKSNDPNDFKKAKSMRNKVNNMKSIMKSQ